MTFNHLILGERPPSGSWYVPGSGVCHLDSLQVSLNGFDHVGITREFIPIQGVLDAPVSELDLALGAHVEGHQALEAEAEIGDPP